MTQKYYSSKQNTYSLLTKKEGIFVASNVNYEIKVRGLQYNHLARLY